MAQCPPCAHGSHEDCEIEDDETGEICSCECGDLPDMQDDPTCEDEEEDDDDFIPQLPWKA